MTISNNSQKIITICGSMKFFEKIQTLKKIFVLFEAPKDQPNSVEIVGLLPIALGGDIQKIKI
jgi:hypothetical protein